MSHECQYQVSFKLSKCEFLSERTEYVGHDICPSGNSPAASKFQMINDWPLPLHGQSLFSFISLVTFYHWFIPYHKLRIKPLRQLVQRYYRCDILIMAWTPSTIKLFNDFKTSITSAPVLARFDPTKPLFLKTDWSAEGMGWILMQPSNDAASTSALQLLNKTGECTFDLSMSGARLQPLAFGSRACSTMESKFHFFTGEAAAGRWGISQNR